MAWTSVLPGSYNYPDILLEWDPTTPPTDGNVVWNDITERLRGWDWGYGRNDELARFEAGTGSLILDNRDRAFDPSFGDAVALTVSGNEVTDLSRMLAVSGDGLTSDSSYGIWEATTNLVTNGGFETNTTGWSVFGGGSFARSAALAKFGVASGSATAITAASGVWTASPLTVNASQPHTASAWVYAAVGVTVRLILRESTVADATVGDTTADVAGNGDWQRVTVSRTFGATGVRAHILTQNVSAGTAAYSFDGVQLEEQPLPTPYVETDGGTAARAAGRVRVPVDAVIDESQSWIALRIRSGWGNAAEPSSFPRLFQWGTPATTAILVFYDSASNTLYARRDSAGLGGAATVAVTIATGDELTVVVRWTATQIGLSVNGAAFTDAANATVPVIADTTFDIGSAAGTADHLDGNLLWFAAGTGTLTNADAATLHAQGNTDPGTNLLAAPTLPLANTFVWAANDANGSSGSPYAGNIKPRKVFRLLARDFIDREYAVLKGYARGYPQSYPAAGYDGLVKVDLVDAFAVLQGHDLATGFSRPEELTGERIHAILDTIGIPASARDIDTGTVTVAAIDITAPGTSALDHAKQVAIESELGQFFLAKNGDVTFHDYTRRLNGTTSQTFTDEPGDDRPYGIAPEPTFDETYLWNYIIATGAGGDATAQIAQDTDSQTDYFTLTKTVSTLLVNGSEIQQVADRYILRYAQPQLRVPSLPLNGAMNPTTLWPVILNLEVSDRIAFERFAPGADRMELWLWVEGIRHTCKPGGPWLTEITTSPADITVYLELNHATLGALDSIHALA